MKYQAELDLAKKHKENDNLKQQKEILQQEITDLEEKKEYLLKTRLMLDEEFCTLGESRKRAKFNASHYSKATAMKRKSEDKKSEIEKIEKALDILTKKKKHIS